MTTFSRVESGLMIMKYVGVDGCKCGWFAVTTDGRSCWEIEIFESITSIWTQHKNASLILIDIPIGLPFQGRRQCDVEARRLLEAPRSSSVFPVPSRSAACGENLELAKAANKMLLGVSLSFQTWSICPKICEVDRFLENNSGAKGIIRESHPEICFWALAGERPMKHSKKTMEGIEERLDVLNGIERKSQEIYKEALSKFPRKYATKDDIVDALALALSACPQGELMQIPSEREEDERGLVMEIVYKEGCIPAS
jgi:predicted RNase H-like nuclease